jgi:DNA invertase Pin-like site-specific DNA recombinase
MPFNGIEELEVKIQLVVKELRRLQRQNKKYLQTVQEVREQKKSLEIELEEYRQQMSQVDDLAAYTKKLEDEKTLLQSKVKNIVDDLDTLEFL